MSDAVAGAGEPVNLLVVDDTPENRLVLTSILSEPGQNVITAASGRDALRQLLRQEFAVILLDVNMPIMDGFETAALVRQRKSTERTPIIFITAFSDEMHVARGYSLGAVDYIVSPVVPEVLRSKVAVFVDLFRKTAQIRRQAESLRRRADQLYQLTEASLAINSANSLDETVEIVTETARDLVGARWALTVTDLEAGHVTAHRPSAFAGEPDGECDRGRLLEQAAAVTRGLADQTRAVLLPAIAIAVEPRWRMLATGCGAAASGWLAVPLTGRDGRGIGWVHLAGRDPESGGEFGDDDRAILTQLAQLAGIAIENLLSSEAREANRLKDEFLTTLSHELRTPLTAILGWTRVLRTSPPDPPRFARGLEVIERNVMTQTKLIEDLLDVSRIIAGKLRVNLRPMALVPAVETAIEGMRPAAEAKGVALELRIQEEIGGDALIAGDADRLQQVGWNLVSNAIKFTPPGGRIEVTVTREEDSIRVAVRDNGKGISPLFLDHVFDRFRQDDSSSTRSHGGLGIGLAIVRHIVELHGGTVEAQSPGVNLGATFTVRLPVLTAATAAAFQAQAGAGAPGVPLAGAAGAPGPLPAGWSGERAAAAAPDAAGSEVRLDRLKVLVVDDEPDTREILCEVLRGAGATVEMAASMSQSLALFDHFRPDVLVSDIAMPGGDGYALVRQLRRRGPERGGLVPAIAVSAHAREEDRQRALAAGFARYVTKPVEPADLLAVVHEVGPARPLDPTLLADPALPVEAARPAPLDPPVLPADPLAPATAPPAEPAPEETWHRALSGADNGQLPNPAGSGRRILLVEDDADTREALKTLLELNGHQVEVAADGGEAVAHALAKRPEVALVDIGLPEMSGNEVARRIRAILSADDILLVALTGYSGEADVDLARAAGFDAHFTKPLELAQLDRLLRSAGRGQN